MKLFYINALVFICLLTSAFAREGSFDKNKEDSYQQILIDVVTDVRVVALIGNRPASVEDVKKSSKDEDHKDLSKRTLLYTGVLKVEKTIKGKLKPGDHVVVTWSQAGHANENGHMSIALSCPHVSRSVAKGARLVFGLTAVSGTFQAWHIVDGPTSLYEPQGFDSDDPFAEKLAEQDGADQPATVLESKVEGEEKLKQEAEERSQ